MQDINWESCKYNHDMCEKKVWWWVSQIKYFEKYNRWLVSQELSWNLLSDVSFSIFQIIIVMKIY